MNERSLRGLDYLAAITALLQRRRAAHPTAGTYETGEVQFWWSRPRSTDDLDQLFWFDDDGEPVAAAILADFAAASSLLYTTITFCLFVLPDATTGQLAMVLDRGLAHAAGLGVERVEIEVDQANDPLLGLLSARGFVRVQADALVECWLSAAEQPPVSSLANGYRLASRDQLLGTAHHMSRGSDDLVEQRLRQASLYRPELDLVALDEQGEPAAQGMFWFDPGSASGTVEPMHTVDEHRQQGLARHILTAGIDRLVRLGAQRISICYEPQNPASGHLYRSVGFVPGVVTDLYAGPTGRGS